MNCSACKSNVHSDCAHGACDCEICDSRESVEMLDMARKISMKSVEADNY